MKPALPSTSARILSVRARFGHVALLLLALTIATIAAGFWAGAAAPDARAAGVLAFATVLALGLAAYAAWTLATRRASNHLQDIVAARMAFSFFAAALAGALGLGFAVGNPGARWAAAGFAIELIAAGAMLANARRRHRQAGGR